MPPLTVAVAVPSLVPQLVGSVLLTVRVGALGEVRVTDALTVQEFASLTVTA